VAGSKHPTLNIEHPTLDAEPAFRALRNFTSAHCQRTLRLVLAVLKPPEIGRLVQSRSRLRVRIEFRISNAKNCRHHGFGPFVPKISMVLYDARIDAYIPIWHVHFTHAFYMPKLKGLVWAVQGEHVAD
jgi:hypothetical protein